MQYRTEHDSLGDHTVPEDAYYGVQTIRALENFEVTGIPISRYSRMVQALAQVKKAACLANMELGLLPEELGDAIVAACREVREGRHDDNFVVDVIQGGAGTSTNMNANEVICNRALEILGHKKGDYEKLHPLNHVNLSQSTNDVYPTAFRIALANYVTELARTIDELRGAFLQKGEEFSDVIKMGRTQLQDAVPITLGDEFYAWGVTLAEDLERLKEVRALLCEVNLGATAVGTGINTVEGYHNIAVQKLADISGLPIRTAENLIEATSDAGAYVTLSGVLKRLAVKLSKVCNDLRLLSSGPFAGLNEINLPPMQPGSSIMPGKVNPVIPELVNQVAFQVIGNDLTVTMAAEAGQLELNVFLPVAAFNLFQGLDMLSRAAVTLRKKCVEGITANKEHCFELVKGSLGVVTALAPVLGYEAAASIVKEAQASGKEICDVLTEKGYENVEAICAYLDPASMLGPRRNDRSGGADGKK